jgi:general secretion pathway protein M
MPLADRLQQLEPRERQLLGVLMTVFAALVLLAVPAGVAALLGSRRADNEALREAVSSIQASRAQIQARDQDRREIALRYANATPPLASYLEKLATQSQLEIPESQDRAPVPHGKRYDERSTKIVLRKVGMLNLVSFMEKMAQSGHPTSVLRLNIRKRATEPDSYDVEMIVSAFDRKPDEKKKEPKGDQGAEP